MNQEETPETVRKPSLTNVFVYFLGLGACGFGGPVALANKMHEQLVRDRGWLSERDYRDGLTIATACPGPLAYQLAVYSAYIMGGIRTALAAAIAFAAAPFVYATSAAWLYTKFAGSSQVQAIFWGVTPVVVAIIAKSCYALAKKIVGKNALAIVMAVIACTVTVVFRRELVLLIVGAGLLGTFLLRPAAGPASPPKAELGTRTWFWIGTMGAVVALALLVNPQSLPGSAILKLFAFFFRTGLLVFGSGLVIVPFLKEYLVDQYHWLDNHAFMDAVAIGLITPGPVVITATFVGYLISGFGGAVASTVGIFAPGVMVTFAGAPLFRRYTDDPRLRGFTQGVGAAVVGVLVGTSLLLGQQSIVDWFTASVAVVSLIVLLRWPRFPEQILVVAGVVIGLILFGSLHR